MILTLIPPLITTYNCGTDSNVWSCSFPQTHQSESRTPTGCPTIQLNSDPLYLETESGSHKSRAQFHNPAPAPADANHKCRLSPVLLTKQLSIVEPISLGSINFPEQLTELGETFYCLYYLFIIEEYDSETVRRKRYIGQDLGNTLGNTLPKPPHVHPPRSLPNPVR